MAYFEYLTHRERQTIQTHLLHVLLYNRQQQLYTTTFDLANWYIQSVEKHKNVMSYFLQFNSDLILDVYYFLEEEKENIVVYQRTIPADYDHTKYVKLKRKPSLSSLRYLNYLIKKQKQVWITDFISFQETNWLIDLLKNNRKAGEVGEA